MSNPLIPPLPLPDDDRTPDESALDPDLDDELIDSADADRLASGGEAERTAEEGAP